MSISDRIGAYTKPPPSDPDTPDFCVSKAPDSWLVQPVTSKASEWMREDLWPGEHGEREFRANHLVVPFGRISFVMDEIFDAGFRVI